MTIPDNIENLSSKEYIIIKGARVHNLKNVDVAIPRNKLIVITGLSGSGKSSLAFDTLYAEGQRRYVESLSSYARQFLGRIDKPDVDYIKGISPAIAIEQKVNSRNPRSTVGTSTEIYDYLKLLYARIGKTFSPVSGSLVKRDTVQDVAAYINSLEEATKIIILAPLIKQTGKTIKDQLGLLLQQGFTRIQYQNEIHKIDDFLETCPSPSLPPSILRQAQYRLAQDKLGKGATLPQTLQQQDSTGKSPFFLEEEDLGGASFRIVIDRITVKSGDEDNENRISDSVQTAFFEGNGECSVEIVGNEQLAVGNVQLAVGNKKVGNKENKKKQFNSSTIQQFKYSFLFKPI